MVLCWLSSCYFAAMVSGGVRFQAFKDPKLVPDGVIGDVLDVSVLSESWLVSNWQLLGLKLNVFDRLSIVLLVVVMKSPAGGDYGA